MANLWGWPLLLKFQRLQNPAAWNRNDTKAARRCHFKTNERREPSLVWHICALLFSKHETEKGTIWRNCGKVEGFSHKNGSEDGMAERCICKEDVTLRSSLRTEVSYARSSTQNFDMTEATLSRHVYSADMCMHVCVCVC